KVPDVLLVGRVEVTAVALVGQLQQPIEPAAVAANARGEPAAHRGVALRGAAEVPVQRMAHDLVLREPHHLARRDAHAVETEALGIYSKLAERRVLLTQAEVLARLARVFSDPELQCRLLRAGERPSNAARSAEKRIDPLTHARIHRVAVEKRCDL